jgi:hypothetical protein
MAVEEWRKPREQMEREAITALAELTAGHAGEAPLREVAALAIIAAHQIPELVELGAFPPGELDPEAMRAMVVVTDIAAGWDDEAESIEDYVGGIEADDLARLAGAARIWARGVWERMVPLSTLEKQKTLAALRRA